MSYTSQPCATDHYSTDYATREGFAARGSLSDEQGGAEYVCKKIGQDGRCWDHAAILVLSGQTWNTRGDPML